MLECPRCKSNAVTMINENLLCLHCGNQEALEDYPVSYREHRSYCREFNQPDPLLMQPEATTDTNDRISKLQNTVNTLMGREVYRQNIQRKQQKPKQKPQQLQRIDV